MSAYSFKGAQRQWAPRDEDYYQAANSHQELITCAPSQTETEASKWSVNMIILLLRLYGAHENLWNTRNEDFRNKSHRTAALIDITAAMGTHFSKKITIAQVVQKINVLRSTYRYEKRRIKQRMRKGIGATTKLKWFALADSFLRHVPRIGKVRRKNDKSESESDFEHEMVLTIDPEAVMPYEGEAIDRPKENSSPESYLQAEGAVGILACNDDKTTLKKFKWTSEHSLRFVQLVKDQPVLWAENYHLADNELDLKALQSIAFEMGITLADAGRKLKIFKEAWNAEMMKINDSEHYKPSFVWWPLAESFMPRKYNLIDFVDANAALPLTPFYENPKTPFTPINPIASVAPPFDAEHESNDDEATCSFSGKVNNFNCSALEVDLLEGKWSLKHSVKFLRLYGAHRCLWDLNSPEYRCREMRAAAIEDIAAVMGHGLTSDYVAKKIKIFRITYMQHRKRMLAATKAGQEPEIQLRWFPLADSFLRPHIGLRSIKEQEIEIPQFNFHYVMANLNLIDPELLSNIDQCD